ncbi:MAG TPA: XRE family transcriptional regulator, partial [Alphaproteobacteria bacterium]|nr:XRE family transcriptional regulator [Alphaproteobacteria bacterium]
LGGERLPADMLALSSETTIHDFFRSQGNHFDSLERAAENLAEEQPCPSDEMQMMLKARLRDR